MVPEKNPYPPHGSSLEIPRGREAKFLEAMYGNKLEFPRGGEGGAKQNTFHGGSMDIFWNCMHIFCFQWQKSQKSKINDNEVVG